MSIGYLLLYVALALVALWLVAELLLQSRAPLVWRAVALAGFGCVVAGMQLGSVLVIGAGAATFALGQAFVTLAVKRGRPVGWSLRRPDGALPGPLAKVPLLGAVTGGAAAMAAAAAAPAPVGEVGPVEAEETEAPYAYEQYQELGPDDGVYAEQPAAYQQQEQQPYYQAEYQQAGYADQQWQQQPGYQYDAYGQPQYQPQYQDPYAQAQYQDPYAAQQQPVQPWSEYQQQPYPGIPQQPGPEYPPAAEYQPQPWDYQQQG
ncbi:hypothetical protein AB0K43_09485 [Kitasatospora sp. NPDC049258]|uniref:hypothetical protein n=1 Tax=Kitasatospora sp. NPDC049258 TaxID=3155394 RepID=UPI003437485B